MFICDCGEIFSAPEYHKGEDHCPNCGSKYFDEAVQCKICGEYVSNDDAYGYGGDRVCKECLKSRKDDIDFLAGATDDAQEIEIPVLYRYIFTDDDIQAILYRAAKELQGYGDFDASDYIDDYANDLAEAYINEEGK